MKTCLVALGFALSAEALIARQETCCFKVTAVGGPGGPLGQLTDGQNRIGQGFPQSTYCIGSDGGLTDQSGRGCILTGPTSQFQCDAGVRGAPGFSVGCDSKLTFNGTSKFVACPTGDQGGFNIYLNAPQGQGGCVDVILCADSCQAGCHAPSPAPASPPPPPPPASTATQKSCPPNLSGMWEFPHLIVPVDESQPNRAYGASYNGRVAMGVSSLFNFDFPSTLAGKTCSLIFLFPTRDKLTTSNYTFSGSGEVGFGFLQSPATEQATYANKPAYMENRYVQTLKEGNSYTIASFACPVGERKGYFMRAMANADPISFEWFQDYNPEPIGLYISAC